jgi:hypothetical protein
MFRDVVTNPDNVSLALVINGEVGVGNAAPQRLGRHI